MPCRCRLAARLSAGPPADRAACRPACLPARLPVCLPACLSVCLSCLSVRLSIDLSICLSVSISVYLPIYLPVYLSVYVCITLVVYTACESCTRPIPTNPGSSEAGEYGLTRATCFVARRHEVVTVVGLLWIWWCAFGGVFWYGGISGLSPVYFLRTPTACFKYEAALPYFPLY